MNFRRVLAMYERHWFMTRRNVPEMFDILYWAFLDLLMWGLLTAFLQKNDVELPIPVAMLLGAVLLWTLLWRTQSSLCMSFLHEVWSRNVITILASPLRINEWFAASLLWSATQLAVGWSVMALLAWLLFEFGMFQVGLAIVPFFGVLMLFGMAMALTVLGLIMRYGHGANHLAWALAGLIMPLSAVYYPVTVLPGWAQGVASALPLARVFEAMRAVLAGAPTPWADLVAALVLALVYVTAAGLYARAMLATMRRRGFVTRYA